MTLEQHLAVLGIAAMIVSGLYVFTPVNDRIFLSGAVRRRGSRDVEPVQPAAVEVTMRTSPYGGH
jgi:hypothetical protein